MSHQNYNNGRPARGPSPRGYQQQFGYPQQYYANPNPYQPNRGYAPTYGYGYPQQQHYQPAAYGYPQNRAYAPSSYQPRPPPNPQTSAKAKSFVPRKKNILIIQKPDGTRVNNTVPKSNDTTAQPPKPPASSESAANSVVDAEPAAKDAGPTKPDVKAVEPTPEVKAVEPTPEVKAVEPTPDIKEANPTPEPVAATAAVAATATVAATAAVAPAADKPVEKGEDVQPIKPASLKIDDDEAPSSQPVKATEKTPAKAKLEPVQTKDLDDSWEDANIKTPGGKNSSAPIDKTYSIDHLRKIRESCNLDPLDSWPALEISKVVGTPRGRDSPRGGMRQRRNYQDPRYDQRRNQAPRQWARGQKPNPRQPPRGERNQDPRQQIKLHKTKNKWSRDKHEMSKAKDHLDAVKKGANSILNKLSVDNFERLLPKFLELDIQTKRQFEGVTEIIFDKALRMPTYCHLYARLCGEVNKQAKMFCDKIVKIVEEEEDGRKVYYYDVGDDERTENVEGPFEESDKALTMGTKVCTFKRVLLNQCQRVFESHSSWEEAFKAAKDPSLSAAEAKKALEAAEETRFKVKQRSLGIVQFVAHLFLNHLLSEKRVHVCMSELLQRVEKELNQAPPITEGVEVFAKIITEVGETIDRGTNKEMIHIYMQNLHSISKTKGLDSRTKFMIMDVIDLREKYKWTPRRKQAKMVSKAEFKKEAEAQLREANRNNKRRDRHHGGGGNNRRHNDRHNDRHSDRHNDRRGRGGYRH